MKKVSELKLKPVDFHEKAKETLQGFSREARHDIGGMIFELQQGEMLTMPDARPMPSIERGAYELRVRDADGIYRVFFLLPEIGTKHFGLSCLYQKNTRHAATRN